jgi:putative flippase GtrA
MPRPDLGLVGRFGLAGLANTLAGFTVIAVLDLSRVVTPPVANAAGYLVGIGISYGLNHGFVFRSTANARVTGPRFVAAAVLAFALNQLVLAVASRGFGDAAASRIASQALGMLTYTAALFIACRVWVFGRMRSAAIDQRLRDVQTADGR